MGVMTSLAIGGMVLSTIQSIRAGQAARRAGEAGRDMAESQAELADYNAHVADIQAQDAIERPATSTWAMARRSTCRRMPPTWASWTR